MPWLADGIDKWEKLAVNDLRTISFIDLEASALILSLPWVVDGIATYEVSAISELRIMLSAYPALAEHVLGFQWVRDNLSRTENSALIRIRFLADDDLELALQVIREPFMEAPFRQRDEYALEHISRWAKHEPEIWAQLAAKPWFMDGLDDLDAAFMHAISLEHRELQQAIIRTPYLASTSVTLPFSGDVGLVVVRHTPFPPGDRTLAALEEAVRAMDGFMRAPLPVGDVILVLVEPEFWTLSSAKGRLALVITRSGYIEPIYIRAIMLALNPASGPLERTLYHETAHYYFHFGDEWFDEGAARFLEAYTVAQTGGESLADRLAYLESHSACTKENIWRHLNPYARGICDYDLGEKFMIGMYQALGEEAVSAALREIYERSQYLEPIGQDLIYYAFLSNAPQGKEEAFKAAYRRYHGSPVVDRVPANSTDRPPLVALYNASNGADWPSSRHWVSDAPLGAWFGVTTNYIGQVTGLQLGENGLSGVIPPELGRLSNPTALDLTGNQLTGEIPAELGNLRSLTKLDLSWNQLTGEIPAELGNLTDLERLFLNGNQLTGELPAELANLTNLRTLFLNHNQLGGEIPPELANLTNLRSLSLRNNRFTGCIAAALPEIWVTQSGLPRC